ncbi:ORF1219 [White spot syndrome virus]|uniref:ORF1219 n=2 Tax=White spot syndrome virus TaxID=342409 RepID=A0A2D3I6S7_9VIRU|nr:ORF1219 [White spot syndrome virus]
MLVTTLLLAPLSAATTKKMASVFEDPADLFANMDLTGKVPTRPNILFFEGLLPQFWQGDYGEPPDP